MWQDLSAINHCNNSQLSSGNYYYNMKCPRRIGTVADTDLYTGSKTDEWKEDDTCSFCGGLKPEKTLELIQQGWQIVRTDKNYKIYLDTPGQRHKVYLQHFSREQIDELNKLYLHP